MIEDPIIDKKKNDYNDLVGAFKTIKDAMDLEYHQMSLKQKLADTKKKTTTARLSMMLEYLTDVKE